MTKGLQLKAKYVSKPENSLRLAECDLGLRR
jgi:hypothetical protein